MSKKKHPSGFGEADPEPSGAGQLFGRIDLEKYAKYAIACLSFALVLVLLVSPKHFFYPSVFVKTFLFYGIIEVIAALFLLLALLNKRYWPRFVETDASGRKKTNWLLALASAYVGAAVLSTLFAANRYASFFGTVDGSNGLLTLLHFWALFVILSYTFREKTFWHWFLRLNVFVGSIIAIFALYQKFVQGTAAVGTFGNPGHLSGYLIFIIFLWAVLLFWSEKKDEKKFWALPGIISLLALFLATDIRGSQLGFVVGIAAALVAYFLAHQKKTVRKIAANMVFVALALGIFLSVYLVSSGKVYGLFERSTTIKTRVINWQIGWQGYLEKPLFGYGLENYYIVFEKHFNPEYYHNNPGLQSTEYGFSLPHNKIVEVAVLSGTLGLVTFLALFLGILRLLYKKFFRTRDKSLLALLGMWTAYFVHLFFLFDSIVSFFMFFSLLAFTHFVLKEPAGENEDEDEKVRLNPVLASVLLAIILAGAGAAVYFFSYRAARADNFAFDALNDMQNKKYEESIASLEKMENIGIFYVSQKALFELSRNTEMAFVQANHFSDSQKSFLQKLIAKNDSSLASDPSQIYSYLNMSRICFIAGKFDKANYEKSNEILQKMIDSGSKRMEAYMYMAENYQALGQNDQAAESGKKALALDPTYGFADYRLASIYHKMGNDDEAIRYIDEAIKNNYTDKTLYDLYAGTAYAKKDYDRSIIAFTKLTKLAPNDPQNYVNLAVVYLEKKDYAKSREICNEFMEKFPELSEKIQAFIDKIPE